MTSAELILKFNETIAEFKQAITNNETDQYEGFNADLKNIESAFRLQRQAEIFDDCAKAENPMLALTEVHHFDAISHKPIKEDGVVVDVDVIYDKLVALDPIKFCKSRKLPLVWANKCEKLAFLLCEDLGLKLNVSDAEMALMRSKYKFALKGSKDQKMGQGSISKTKFANTLQDIVDSLLYLGETGKDGKERNRIRIINADVEFIKRFFTKGGNEAELSIKTVDSKGVAKAVFAAMHRILMKKSYTVKFKIDWDSNVDAGKDEVSAAIPVKDSSNASEPLTMQVPAPAPEVPASETIPEDTLPSLDQMEEV